MDELSCGRLSPSPYSKSTTARRTYQEKQSAHDQVEDVAPLHLQSRSQLVRGDELVAALGPPIAPVLLHGLPHPLPLVGAAIPHGGSLEMAIVHALDDLVATELPPEGLDGTRRLDALADLVPG